MPPSLISPGFVVFREGTTLVVPQESAILRALAPEVGFR